MGELRTAKAELETTLKTHVEETEVSLVALQSDKKMLQMELAHYEQRLGQGTAQRETAVISAISGLEEQARHHPYLTSVSCGRPSSHTSHRISTNRCLVGVTDPRS